MNLSLLNPSGYARQQWVTFTLPFGSETLVAVGQDGDVYPVQELRKTPALRLMAVRPALEAFKFVPFSLVEGNTEVAPPAGTPPRLTMHFVFLGGVSSLDLTSNLTALGPCVFRGCARVPRTQLVAHWVFLPFDEDGLCTWRVALVNSGADPDPRQTIERVILEADCYLASDSRPRLSAAKQLILAENMTFGDSTGRAWTGVALNPENLPYKPGNMTFWTTLTAAVDGPVCAVTDAWQKVTLPKWAKGESLLNWRNEQAKKFYDSMRSPDYKVRFALGQNPQPGDTGDQHGFGAIKLAQALAGDPFWVWHGHHDALLAAALRPGHYRNEDGTALVEAVPGWVTWNEKTHHNTGVSPDRRGKDPSLMDYDSGWTGRDNQHHSPLVECLAYQLTGCPLLEVLLEDVGNRLLSGLTVPSIYGQKSTNSMDEARAVGRTAQSIVWLSRLLGREELLQRGRQRVEECVLPQWAGKELPTTAAIRVLTVHHDPRLPQGVGWRPPFEAMGGHGLYLLGDRDVCWWVLRSVVWHGVWLDPSGRYRMAWGIHFKEDGSAYDQADYQDPNIAQIGGGDWEDWSYPGVAVCADLAAARGDWETLGRCHRLMHDFGELAREKYEAMPDKVWRWVEWTTEA